MELLEFFYEHESPRSDTLPRNAPEPSSKRLCVTGPKYCGKRSWLKHNALARFDAKKVLFLDCADLRCEKESLDALEAFIDEKEIELLCVADYDQSFALPSSTQIWITSTTRIEGFDELPLANLSFEEFLAFEKRSDPKVALNLFLKWGNFPEIPQLPETKKERRSQEILRLSFGEDLFLFKEVAFFQGYAASAHFIFKRLKERYKVSKDRFYNLFDRWQEEGYIHAVPKWGAKRAAKKLFFYNFLAKPLLYTQREFPKIFENMLFLELREECYYLEPLGFYLPKSRRLVVAIPFGNEVRIQNKIDQILAKSSLEIEKIEVVTVASSFRYEIEGVECEIAPFYEWALGE
ncbi:MAG: hypothetical protein C6H99_04295 [Epsilonproteobacteria bacterium]|nr:hypothetical protein [Campylobacterota bacterium]NPA64654.1 ATP-binding protein [Campylobacterota bacterium]